MDRSRLKEDLVAFLRTIQRPDNPIGEIADDLNFTESGLIDSLALLQIINYLEENYQIDFQAMGADPNDLRSVNSVLALIERARAS